ncbi:SURF1 family protein [Nocardioides mangrovicus]|uniref:SURF1-like protein n=1 Tax=Nocardioides mangrovicus TaxID=2478913 RepID=A0A3L8P0W7_9ACTN|nr:SURF1 family protein [Nocardioides mangrovicus]RLV48764.1 SURF1 family protein [Nocardioides mangrovicus]
MGFLLSRRWLGFFLAVAVLAVVAWRLGVWQFHRLDERRSENRTIVTNLAAAPLPADEVLPVGRALPEADEWRRVTITGRWDDRHTVVLKYQTRKENPGVDVVTPLVTSSGRAVVVDRGWMVTQNNGQERPRTPTATTGQVTVTGYARVDATGGAATVHDLQTRALSSLEIGRATGHRVYRGFVMLTDQAPTPAVHLRGPELPAINDGPHFFYGLQWWFFALLAVGGFCYLAWDELRQRRATRPSEERERAGAEVG